MTVSIDKAGRILLPKPLRDQFSIRAGAEFDIRASEDGIALKLLPHEPVLRKVRGMPIHRGMPQGELRDMVEDFREERLRSLSVSPR